MALPDRDHGRSAQEQGLFGKYRVTRCDGREDPPGSRYFVLRLGTDASPPNRAAIAAFADACEAEYPLLAADLRREVGA